MVDGEVPDRKGYEACNVLHLTLHLEGFEASTGLIYNETTPIQPMYAYPTPELLDMPLLRSI